MTNDNTELPEGNPEGKETGVQVPPTGGSLLGLGLAPTEPAGGSEPVEKGRPPIRLSKAQVTGIVALAFFTLLITWRTKALEKAVADRSPASEMVSKDAPNFSLPALDGSTVTLADYSGKKAVVMTFWASWCGPCRAELPQLREFYKEYHKDDSNFEVLAISIDEEKSDAEQYATSEKLPFPVLLDPRSKVAEAYSVEAIPTLFVIKNGKVTRAHMGLEETMQFELMNELGIKFPGVDKAGETKDDSGSP